MEIHGYTERGFIDATINGQRTTIPDDLANRHRQMVAEWEAAGNVIPPYVAPPPGAYRLYKSTFSRRLSSPEAAAMEELLNGEDPWLRMLYHSVEYFMSDDALFTYLHFVLKETLGMEKADALLAPEAG